MKNLSLEKKEVFSSAGLLGAKFLEHSTKEIFNRYFSLDLTKIHLALFFIHEFQ